MNAFVLCCIAKASCPCPYLPSYISQFWLLYQFLIYFFGMSSLLYSCGRETQTFCNVNCYDHEPHKNWQRQEYSKFVECFCFSNAQCTHLDSTPTVSFWMSAYAKRNNAGNTSSRVELRLNMRIVKVLIQIKKL